MLYERQREKGFFSNQLTRSWGPDEDMGGRVLNGYDLKPPDYYVEPNCLIEENVEKIVKYAGMIGGVVADMDITNRTDVLRVIDKGKKQGLIPPKVGYDHDAIFSLNVNNIKISRYNQSEDLLLRVPMHEIAAACYIKDDDQHILALKHGTLEDCSLSVLYCNSKQAAEELCALIGQCFQLVYTEATMHLFIPRSIGTSSSSGSSDVSDSPTVIPMLPGRPSFSLPYDDDSILNPGRSEASEGSIMASENSVPADLVKDYMSKLHQKMTPDELHNFAELLRSLYSDMPVGTFCEHVLQLYGQDRKPLLAELSPFIPSEGYSHFLDFLRKNGILFSETGTVSSTMSNPRNRRSVSELSTTSTITNSYGEDVEQILTMVTDQIALLDTSDTNSFIEEHTD
ncbi:cerebral cavernous malformations protein 2 homolog isoform X3 [Haliotis rufescens]|uniref:cerebral cavernous malformations protein 2 homolog isoform X3 n=1 Tax=Haliotis rufescens TaxID=6454 RepID=UPI00201F849A|nr:cerebral cavernous malformations protein 2 homolog isoform X3 [Haliotis rufescens]